MCLNAPVAAIETKESEGFENEDCDSANRQIADLVASVEKGDHLACQLHRYLIDLVDRGRFDDARAWRIVVFSARLIASALEARPNHGKLTRAFERLAEEDDSFTSMLLLCRHTNQVQPPTDRVWWLNHLRSHESAAIQIDRSSIDAMATPQNSFIEISLYESQCRAAARLDHFLALKGQAPYSSNPTMPPLFTFGGQSLTLLDTAG
jgi:hypothetical protein